MFQSPPAKQNDSHGASVDPHPHRVRVPVPSSCSSPTSYYLAPLPSKIAISDEAYEAATAILDLLQETRHALTCMAPPRPSSRSPPGTRHARRGEGVLGYVRRRFIDDLAAGAGGVLPCLELQEPATHIEASRLLGFVRRCFVDAYQQGRHPLFTFQYVTIVGIMRLYHTNTLQMRVSATVISPRVMHDNIDDSLDEYDYIFHMFGAGVADLLEELHVPLLMDFDHCFRVIRIMSLVISTFIFFGILKLLVGCTAINVI
ncbi:hypothetical protein ZWY2020_004375 [Hordeum vulgare]|nr:hypothetical protein ZWY2020_004375 [Hordeum vulgare]